MLTVLPALLVTSPRLLAWPVQLNSYSATSAAGCGTTTVTWHEPDLSRQRRWLVVSLHASAKQREIVTSMYTSAGEGAAVQGLALTRHVAVMLAAE